MLTASVTDPRTQTKPGTTTATTPVVAVRPSSGTVKPSDILKSQPPSYKPRPPSATSSVPVAQAGAIDACAIPSTSLPPPPPTTVTVTPKTAPLEAGGGIQFNLEDWKKAAREGKTLSVKTIIGRIPGFTGNAFAIGTEPNEPTRVLMASKRRLEWIIKRYATISEKARCTAWLAHTATGFGAKPSFPKPGTCDQYDVNMHGESVTAPNFVDSYKGINFGAPLWKPVVDGNYPLWWVEPPFDDDHHAWGLYAKYLGNETFELRLQRLDRTTWESIKAAGDALVAVVQYACGLLAGGKAQSISNYAALVPTPQTQAALAGYQVIATACGIAFPPPNAGPITCGDIPVEDLSFWGRHKTMILVGGGLAVAGLIAYRLRR